MNLNQEVQKDKEKGITLIALVVTNSSSYMCFISTRRTN